MKIIHYLFITNGFYTLFFLRSYTFYAFMSLQLPHQLIYSSTNQRIVYYLRNILAFLLLICFFLLTLPIL